MNSSAYPALSRAIRLLEKHIPADIIFNSPYLTGGSYNEVQISYLDKTDSTSIETKENKSTQAQPIAILVNREQFYFKANNPERLYILDAETNKKIYNEHKEAMLKAYSLLSELSEEPSPFLQKFLAFGEKRRVTFFAEGENLKEYLKKHGAKLNEDALKEIILQILLAVDFLHSKEWVHRDISLSNFLVYEEKDQVNVKLADLDSIARADDTSLLTVGSDDYSPPEILKDKMLVDEKTYQSIDKKAVDRYSVGIVLRHMAEFVADGFKSWLRTIADAFTVTKPADRKSVSEILQKNFTHEEIRSTQTKFKRNDYRNGYYLDAYPTPDNNFHLLPKPMQDIYLVGMDLKDKLDFLIIAGKQNRPFTCFELAAV